jgi:hypothetical protein
MQLDAGIVLDAAVSAAQKYAALMVDDDPDDGKHVVPGELRRFCARLRLLNGVPFSYLVPDAELFDRSIGSFTSIAHDRRAREVC